MLSSKTKRNISLILPYGFIWLIFSIVYTLLEKGLLSDLTYYPSTGNPYNFTNTILITPISAFFTGLLIGSIEILFLNKFFIQKSFGRKIVYKSIIYLATILIFLIGLSALSNVLELHQSIFNVQVWKNVLVFVSSYAFLSVGIFMSAIIVITQFYTEVSYSLGQGVLHNFFLGKYHTPKEEERIFMFLDLKSSTTIAEHLGHVRYFEMLREYFSDLSEPIVAYSGEIYQYAGDEIIVSWKLKIGLKNNNCISCFYALKDAIRNQTTKYHEKFGLLPEFKAGFHLGKVTAGEIGVLKKEIIFTGDVLNTTARIQGLCNTYNVDILISNDLANKLALTEQYQLKSIGENELKGRDEKIELFTIFANQ
jgi:adenylate cyclase